MFSLPNRYYNILLLLVLALVISYSLTWIVGSIQARSSCESESSSNAKCSPDDQKVGEGRHSAVDHDNEDEPDKGNIESEIPSSPIVPFP
jgi:hypothetical protein